VGFLLIEVILDVAYGVVVRHGEHIRCAFERVPVQVRRYQVDAPLLQAAVPLHLDVTLSLLISDELTLGCTPRWDVILGFLTMVEGLAGVTPPPMLFR